MGPDVDEISVKPLRPQDQLTWLPLWRGYQTL